MADNEFETLLYQKRDRIAVITLNRPERLNAINGKMSRELPVAWSAAKRDPDVRAVVVTGAGDRALCTGFDVADIADSSASVGEDSERGTYASLKLTAIHNRCWKPVITAVNGMAVGGGLHFVADSDLVIAAEHAVFFDSHVGVGLVAGLEPIGFTRRVGMEHVLRMALMGSADRMSAARAREAGLVGEVVAKHELVTRALSLAEQIAANSPSALAATKRAIWQSLDRDMHAAIENGRSVIEEYRGHPDAAEGARAFGEKREPRWAPLSIED
jgi:enoyl-CoA hydratase/carnithine racemase